MASTAIPWRARLTAAMLKRAPDWPAFAATKAIGTAARLKLPRPVVGVAVSAYSRYYGVALDEVDPLSHARGYTSFDEFFTRQLRAGARPIDSGPDAIVSPCDGRLRGIASITGAADRVEAKGHDYTLGELVGDNELAARCLGGEVVTIYLHPRDYHRVHTPVDGRVERVQAIPGRLLPVTDASLRCEPRLFARNERLVHTLETERGPVVVVMVAAFGVGHMTCAYAPVPAHPRVPQTHRLERAVELRRGEELGRFHLGSTVVMLVPPGCRTLESIRVDERSGRAVRLGEPLLTWRGAQA
ncbi:MAG: phosphatidylserine decarboxylase [Myxococcales bacterium FL481]|nr:MAG: phosphatidylserine decarboxylase [Myxococcales bacterium FL481]